MAILNISDLSVGDWVRYEGKEYQVQCVDGMSEMVTLFGYCEQREESSGNLRPIPITAEILEKIGVLRYEREADNPEEIVCSNHFIVARTYTDADWWRVQIYAEEFPIKELFNGIIYSVHDLQHALRLAGLDKEINL